MSQIKMTLVKVNGQPIRLPVTVHTCPKGSDREKLDNIFEFRLISRIDRKYDRPQGMASVR